MIHYTKTTKTVDNPVDNSSYPQLVYITILIDWSPGFNSQRGVGGGSESGRTD